MVYNFRLGLKVACSRRLGSGVRREGREREKNKEEKRERGRKTGEICFQKVIPPSLSASNPNVVSGVKSCQSTNGGRQTAMFNTELKKYICLYSSFIFVFCKRIYAFKTPKMKELASITRSTFSAVDFHPTDHIIAAVGFCCYYWNAVGTCLSVKASTRSFGRCVKRIEISKARSETSAFVPFHKIGFQNIQVNVLTASSQEFQG